MRVLEENKQALQGQLHDHHAISYLPFGRAFDEFVDLSLNLMVDLFMPALLAGRARDVADLKEIGSDCRPG